MIPEIDLKFVFTITDGPLIGLKAIMYAMDGADMFLVCFKDFEFPSHCGLVRVFLQQHDVKVENLHGVPVHAGSPRQYFERPGRMV